MASIREKALCYRCEHRATFLETGYGPRFECKQTGSVLGCYMYRPVAPLVLAADDGDERPFPGPPMIAARHHGVDVPVALDLKTRKIGEDVLMYWVPSEEKGEDGERSQ